MERIRIGNDISVSWALFELSGQPYDFDGKELSLYMVNGGHIIPVASFTIDGNIISWSFLGSEQTATGFYSIIAKVENVDVPGSLYSFDYKNAFALVASSRYNEQSDEQLVNISLRSLLVFNDSEFDLGTRIDSIEQIVESHDNGGINVVRVNLEDGTHADFNVRNGHSGADEEDITDSDGHGALKFKDRSYNSENPDGMGYIILRKNKEFSEQVVKSNTVYEIRYDFNLDGNSVSVPEDCILFFVGGSITNGSIVFNNTRLEGNIRAFCEVSGTIANETIYTKWFYLAGNDISVLLLGLLADNKKIIVSKGNYITRRCIDIVDHKNLDIDFGGATIIDETQGESQSLDGRVNPFVYIRRSSGIKVHNLKYSLSSRRQYHSDTINTDSFYSFWVGEYGTTVKFVETFDIELYNITADFQQELSQYCFFIGILGNTYNVRVHDLECDGNIQECINIEWGLRAATREWYQEHEIDLPDNYGAYPYNCKVYNIVGKNSPISQGYLRVAGAYNVILENCYGYNVNNFIHLYSGDFGIMRCQGSVIINNCKTYYDEDYDGAAPYIYAGVSQLALSDYSHVRYKYQWIFNNCEFQAGETNIKGFIRLEGNDGKTIFNNCVFNNANIEARNIYHDAFQPEASMLRVVDCQFNNCQRAFYIDNSNFIQIENCRFVTGYESSITNIENSHIYIALSSAVSIRDCRFKYTGSNVNSFIGININCSNAVAKNIYNKIEHCMFTGHSVPAINNGYLCIIKDCRDDLLLYNDVSHYSYNNDDALIDISNYQGDTLSVNRSSKYSIVSGSSITLRGVILEKDYDRIIIYKKNSSSIIFVPNSAPEGYLSFRQYGENVKVYGEAIIILTKVPNTTRVSVNIIRSNIIFTEDYTLYDRSLLGDGLLYDKTKKKLIVYDGSNNKDCYGFSIAPKSGPYADRPTSLLSGTDAGFMYYDTTNKRPIYWSGAGWYLSDGSSPS